MTAFEGIARDHLLALRGFCASGLGPRSPLVDMGRLLGSALRCPSHLPSSFSTSAHLKIPPNEGCGLQIDTINAPLELKENLFD